MQDQYTTETVDVMVGDTTLTLPQLTEEAWANFDWASFEKCYGDTRFGSNVSLKFNSSIEAELSSIVGSPITTHTLSQNSFRNLGTEFQTPKSKQILIGICGKKGHGKDTIASYFTSRSGFVQLAFADPLKDAVKALFNVSDTQLHDPKEKEMVDPRWNMTPRQMMQKLGTFIRDNLYEDFFVDHLSERSFGIPRVCVSDVRRQNEAKFIKDAGGILIKVFRPGMEDLDNHESETDLENINENYLVFNDGNIDTDLFGKLDVVLDNLRDLQFQDFVIL